MILEVSEVLWLKGKIASGFIVVLAVIVTAILAFFIPYHSNPKEQDGYSKKPEKENLEVQSIEISKEPTEAPISISEENEEASLSVPEENEEVLSNIPKENEKITSSIPEENEKVSLNIPEENIEAPLNIPEKDDEVSSNISRNDGVVEIEEVRNENKTDIDVSEVKEILEENPEKYSDEWVDRKIEEHRDEILESDLTDFRNIIGKLDIAYANSLLENSDAEQGFEDFKQYIHSVLTDGEYVRAKELFSTYNFILEEE